MVRLTEDMIVARTRVSDMGSVKKLNCWGAELTDVTVLRKLTNVEVLSLSVNNISTLEDISHCRNLQELYIRKNKIPDISEICWLRDLPRLKNIWLEENPCSEGGAELYRYTVIKTLPQLQKLDNTPVASEEMAEAMRRGLDLNHPLEGGGAANYPAEDRRISREEVVMERKVSRGQYGNYSEQEYEQNSRRESVQSPSRRVSNQVFEDSRMSYSQSRHSLVPEEEPVEQEVREVRRSTSVHEMSPALRGPEDDLRRMSIREESLGRFEDGYRNQRNSYSGPDPRAGQQYNGNYNYAAEHQARQQQHGSDDGLTAGEQPLPPPPVRGGSRATTPLEPTPSSTLGGSRGSRNELNSLVEEGPGSRGSRSGQSSLEGDAGRRSGVSSLEEEQGERGPKQMSQAEMHAVVSHHYNSTYRQVDQQLESAHQLLSQRRSNSPPQRPYPVRPKNRNSNVLSAILCLIKEIDGPSLEVVEMAVRCRMEELED